MIVLWIIIYGIISVCKPIVFNINGRFRKPTFNNQYFSVGNIFKVMWDYPFEHDVRVTWRLDRLSVSWCVFLKSWVRARVPEWVRTNTAWVRTRFCKLQKVVFDSQPHVIKFTSCLPMVVGSFRVLRPLPPLNTGRHDIAESGVKHNQSSINQTLSECGGVICFSIEKMFSN